MVTWSTERLRSAIISSRSRYVSEYRRHHRTHRRMITSSKCRPRKRAGRFRVTIHRTKSASTPFATEPTPIAFGSRYSAVVSKYPTHSPRLTLPQGSELQFRTLRDHLSRKAENYLTRFSVIGPGPPSPPPPSILIWSEMVSPLMVPSWTIFISLKATENTILSPSTLPS